jgi:hypothetical protein
MARSEARLQFAIWRGVESLPPLAKLLYVVLLTEPTVNHAGVGALRESLWAQHAGLTADEASKALTQLQDERHVLVDTRTQEVLIRTIIRNDGVADQPNILKAACVAARLVQSPKLRAALAAELRKLPPKPPDVVTPAGRKFVHADPHAVAAELDPRPDPGPGVASDIPNGQVPQNPSQNPSPEPFGNPSGTLPDRNPSGTLPEPFTEPPGVGVGEGEGGSPPVGGYVRQAGLAGARAREAGRPAGRTEHPTPAELNATAVRPDAYRLVADWARSTGGVTNPQRRNLGKAVDELLAAGAEVGLIAEALDETHRPEWRDPVRSLPSAYDRVRRRRYPPPVVAEPVTPRPSTTDRARAEVRAAFDQALGRSSKEGA